jgi:heptosyltransferase II
VDRPNSFLIIQTAFIGDVILATALIEKLHEYYPTAAIDFLVRKGNESLLTSHPYIREVIVFDKKRKYRNLVSLVKKIRGNKYDELVNVQRYATTGFLSALSMSTHKIGFDKNPLSFFNSTTITHSFENVHEVTRNQKLIEHLTDSIATKPRLYPSLADFETIQKYQNRDYFCLAPTSVWFTKQWPSEKWIELIRILSTKVGSVFLLGAPSDTAICEAIKLEAGVANVVNLAGRLSFLESAALMKSAKMNFVNDSAPMHLASAMNAPVTAIYCSTIPSFGFGPLSDRSFIVESAKKLPCRPCGLHGHKNCPEGHFECANSITNTEVCIGI